MKEPDWKTFSELHGSADGEWNFAPKLDSAFDELNEDSMHTLYPGLCLVRVWASFLDRETLLGRRRALSGPSRILTPASSTRVATRMTITSYVVRVLRGLERRRRRHGIVWRTILHFRSFKRPSLLNGVMEHPPMMYSSRIFISPSLFAPLRASLGAVRESVVEELHDATLELSFDETKLPFDWRM